MFHVRSTQDIRSQRFVPDDYIPLTVEWPGLLSGEVFYLGIDGASGGHLQLAVDVEDGSLHEFQVLALPPRGAVLPRHDLPSTTGHVSLDLTTFADVMRTCSKVNIDAPVRLSVDAHAVLFAIGESAPVREVVTGAVRIGISAENRIASVSVPSSAVPLDDLTGRTSPTLPHECS